MSMSRTDDTDGTIRKHSGWLIPLAALFVLFILSVFFLLYYLVPTPPPLFSEQVSPTSDVAPVAFRTGGLNLWIPANYTKFATARKGGARREIALFALMPDLAGWSNWNASTFAEDGPTSRVVHMTIRADAINLSEADRLKRVYSAYIASTKGTPAPFGLTRYAFRNDSGYRAEDLLVGDNNGAPVVMRCVRAAPDVPNPSCLRDVRVAKGAALSYRFKRMKLNHWREIATGVDKLIGTFEKPPGK
jgi:hypothetical protein